MLRRDIDPTRRSSYRQNFFAPCGDSGSSHPGGLRVEKTDSPILAAIGVSVEVGLIPRDLPYSRQAPSHGAKSLVCGMFSLGRELARQLRLERQHDEGDQR